MSDQPEALRLAEFLEEAAGDYGCFDKRLGYASADLLRRQHAEIERLYIERERDVKELANEIEALTNVLLRNGFVRCDIAACNCGSWHARYGLRERMDEITETLADAGHPLSNDNGNLTLNALKELIAEVQRLREYADTLVRERNAAWAESADLRKDAERYRWLRATQNTPTRNHPENGRFRPGAIDNITVYEGTEGTRVALWPSELDDAVDAEARRSSKDAGPESVSIVEIGLRTVTINTLMSHGISTVADLCVMTDYELARLRGVGRALVSEVSQRMAARGYTLAERRRWA